MCLLLRDDKKKKKKTENKLRKIGLNAVIQVDEKMIITYLFLLFFLMKIICTTLAPSLWDSPEYFLNYLLV